MVELLAVCHELDTSFNERLAVVTALGELFAIARLAHRFPLVFGEGFSRQRLVAVYTRETAGVIGVPVMLHGRGLDDLFTLEANLKRGQGN